MPPFLPSNTSASAQPDDATCPQVGLSAGGQGDAPAFPVVEVAKGGPVQNLTYGGVRTSAHPHPYASPRPHPGVSPYAPVRTSAYPRVYK